MILVNLNLNLNGIRSPSVVVHVIAVIIVNLIAIIVVWPFFFRLVSFYSPRVENETIV